MIAGTSLLSVSRIIWTACLTSPAGWATTLPGKATLAGAYRSRGPYNSR